MKKRFALGLVLLVALVMGATAANAATIKAAGSWQVDAAVTNNNDFSDVSKDNAFSIGQRMRTAFQFIANENLKGVLETQMGTSAWGNGALQVGSGRSPNTTAGVTASTLGAGQGNFLLRKGYIDFKWPNTKVNFLVGYQSLALPTAFGVGSAILDDHVAGAAVVVPVNNNISVVGGYVRPYDSNTYGATAAVNRNGTSTDAAFLITNLDYTGFKVAPFVAYANSGAHTTGAGATGGTMLSGIKAPLVSTQDGFQGYWAGAAFTMTAFEPVKVMADLNYGKANFNNNNTKSGRSGWLGDIAVDYTGLSMMTPEVFFAYSSGEGSNGVKSDRMPSLTGENFSYGTFWMQGGDSLANSYQGPGALGFWAAGVSLKDIKLIDKLSHTVHLIYFKGTNNKAFAGQIGQSGYGSILTTKDSLVEFDLNSKYQIYEELSLGLELGYINANFDKSLWSAATGWNSGQLSKDAYKATFLLNYSF